MLRRVLALSATTLLTGFVAGCANTDSWVESTAAPGWSAQYADARNTSYTATDGAAGVTEVIYSLLMLQHDFVCASANIENLDPAGAGMPIARERVDQAGLNTVMSNSFGFGGTNASLVFRRLKN